MRTVAYIPIGEALDWDWLLISIYVVCLFWIALRGIKIITVASRLWADDNYRKMQGKEYPVVQGLFLIIGFHSFAAFFGIVCIFKPVYWAFVPLMVISVIIKHWVASRMQGFVSNVLAKVSRLESAEGITGDANKASDRLESLVNKIQRLDDNENE